MTGAVSWLVGGVAAELLAGVAYALPVEPFGVAIVCARSSSPARGTSAGAGRLCHAGLASESIAAVAFGMESSAPHRHGKVLEGLERFTARTKVPVDSTFFASHVSVGEVHSAELFSAAMPLFEGIRPAPHDGKATRLVA